MLNPLFLLAKKPLAVLGRGLFKLLSVLYRWYLPVGRKLRLNRVFNSQRIAGFFTHKYVVQTLVIVLTFIVTASNLQAKEQQVLADEYGRNSILYSLVRSEDELIEETATETANGTSAVAKSTTVMNTLGSVAYNSQKSVVIDDTNTSVMNAASVSTSQLATTEEANRAPEAPFEHTVQGGETISTIAAKYGISINTILWENNLTEKSYIRPGQKLTILPTSGVSHTVKSGDTVLAIAKKYEVDATEITKYNKLADAGDITVGMKLVIPGGKIIAPVVPKTSPSTRLAVVRSNPVYSGPSTPTLPNAPISGGRLQWPTTARRISQYMHYGHTGIDVDGNFGDPNYAAEAGTVTFAGWRGGYGLFVIVDHGNGLVTRYGHFQKIYVQTGQKVSRGQTLGEQGSTGRSTGSHLHFEVMVGGRFVNPFTYL